MRWIDPKFKGNRKNYMIQSSLALFVVFVMSLFNDIFIQTTIMVSLGASVFILFTMPHKQVSRGRYIFGGYTIGILSGSICTRLMMPNMILEESFILALAVGLAMFFMVVTNTEHPPAAGLAMGIAIDGADYRTIVAVYLCLVIVFIGKKILERWLIDLM